MADREGVFNKLMGLSGYIPLMCSRTPNYTLPEDLMNNVVDFIFDQSNPYQNSKALILMGQSGGGKSLFLLQLIRTLN